ncbi:MAG: MMPL family transporter [Sporocytophaga sp.]|uniref:efflux RND transporter permease subunit n=1 Tax=Sporocytophaga sp. TaxID=2231183 RepID=UPI001B217624|nr:MMPL family transporter [Sporocytophaga sp.]MBO9699904.1 MMPL family transporter [Sporocytophaga sp.]
MKRITNSISEYFANLPDQVRKRKLLFSLFFIGATVACFFGMQKSKFDLTIEGWFAKNDPVYVAFNEYHAQFGSEDGVYIVYKPKDGNVFSHKSLEAIRGIREELLDYRSKLKEGEKSALDHIVKINSLVNAPVLAVEEDMLISKPLVSSTIPTSAEELDQIRKTAEAQRSFPLQYFSKDLKYGGMYIETDFGAIPEDSDVQADQAVAADMEIVMDGSKLKDNVSAKKETPRFKPTDMADYTALNNAIKAIIDKPEYANHLEYYAVGNTAGSEYQNIMVAEMGMLYLAAFVIIIVLLWFLFRSLSAVVWGMLIVFLTTIWTLGISALLGLPFTSFLILTVLLILTVGIADSVHLMSGYMFYRKTNHDHSSALRHTYKSTGAPMLMTAITNMAGILALNISDLVPIQNFAWMSTLGIFLALFLSIFLLPLMLDLWPPVPKIEKTDKKQLSFIGRIVPNFALSLQKSLDKVIPAVEKRPILPIISFLSVFVICIIGASMVKVDTSLTDTFPEDSRWNKNVRIVDEKMSGSSRIAIYLDLGKDDGLQDPQVLKVIDELQQKFEKKYTKYVVTTSSIVNVVKDSYQKLNQGQADKYIIPSDEKQLSQTLFLFNNANPDDRRRMIDDNYRKANISVTLHTYGSYEYTRVFDEMQKDIHEAVSKIKKKYPDTFVSVTGGFALAMKTADYLTQNEFKSFGLALFVISIILLLVFGSFKAGLISIIPNLIPSVLTFGIMGWFEVPLDFFTMMLAPVIIGVSVDDTSTFISQYRLEVLKDGNIKRALKHTMKESGQAIVFTSLILGLGFGIMSIAESTGTANVGKFGSLAIFAGLLCDLFLLPALIMVFKLNFQKKGTKFESNQEQYKELIGA